MIRTLSSRGIYQAFPTPRTMVKQAPANQQMIKEFLDHHPQWSIQHHKLHREYVFPDFVKAFEFMSQIAIQAEVMNHHPEWFNVYNKLIVDLTTHDAQAITLLDIQLASHMDKLFSPHDSV